MKKQMITLLIALTLPLTVSAFPGGEGSGPQGHRGNKVERLANKLNLTAEQKTKVKAIFKQQKQKIVAVKEQTRTQMQDILSPEQMNQFDLINQQRQEKRQRRHGEFKNKQQNRMQMN